MTVNDVEKQVLRLLDEVGADDYSDRMYKLINEAQREIACTWGFIRKAVKLSVTAGEPVALPVDCYSIERADNDDFELVPVEVDGEWQMGIVFSEGGDQSLIYKAYPDTIEENDTNKKIQLAPEYHTALCCYTAALTQQSDNKKMYQIFMERYNNSIAQVQNAGRMNGKARVVISGRAI